MSDRFSYHRQALETGRARSNPRRAAELPDPPDNPEFEELPEHAQRAFAQRFDAGVLLTEQRDVQAYRAGQRAWQNWVHRCYQNRLREREEGRRDRAQREAILEQNRRRVR